MEMGIIVNDLVDFGIFWNVTGRGFWKLIT